MSHQLELTQVRNFVQKNHKAVQIGSVCAVFFSIIQFLLTRKSLRRLSHLTWRTQDYL